MSMTSFHLQIVTPDGLIFDGQAQRVIAYGATGSLGILARHTDMVTPLGMGEASILEMYLAALPEVVKNAALPLAQTDKIVMYGDGNPTRMVRDVMNSSGQIIEGLKEATGIDLTALLSAYAAGKQGAQAQQAEE